MSDIGKAVANKITSLLGVYDPTFNKMIRMWRSTDGLYTPTITRSRQNREFLLGSQWESVDLAKTDRIHRVFNYGSQLLRKFQMYEGAKGFDINVKYLKEDQLSIIMAEATEALAYRIVESAGFYLKWMDSKLAKSLYGTVYFAPVWNPENKKGSEKGTVEIRGLTPERCRVLFQDNDFETPEAFITIKRMSVDVAKRIYGDAVQKEGGSVDQIVPDFEGSDDEYHKAVRDYVFGVVGSATYDYSSDKMVTIWNYTDTENYYVYVGSQKASEYKHGYTINGKGFCPVVSEPNIYLMGYQLGIDDLYFVSDALRCLNKLYSLLEEVIEDNAYPIMFELNNALRGKKLKRGELRGKVVPITVTPGEKGVDVLQAPVVIQPILSAIEMVKASIFDISSMPAAAFGAYQPNTKSGFQATVQMQPALQEVAGRQLRSGSVISSLLRMCIAILEKEYPEALQIELPEEKDPVDGSIIAPAQKIKLENLSSHDIEIIFGNPLPKDDAATIQNETAKEKNGYQSARTTMQNLGIESPTREGKLIEEDRIRIAKVEEKVQEIIGDAQVKLQAKIAQIQMEAQQAAQQQAQPGGGGQGGLQPNANPQDQAATGAIKPGQNPKQAFPQNKEGQPASPTGPGVNGGAVVS